VLYVDAARFAPPGEDGIHLSMDSHTRLAELVASTLLTRLRDGVAVTLAGATGSARS
jgi:hypothetical protein